MTPKEIWCNEAQERYLAAIAPEQLELFAAVCARERCPFAVIGTSTDDDVLQVEDQHFDNCPVDMRLEVLLGKPPKMTRQAKRLLAPSPPLALADIDLTQAAYKVLRLPCVADKSFLITIGDRSVGGLTARDQMVGPWQIPVADVALTSMGFNDYVGEAFAMGERTPVALIDPRASGRMAIGEAITNIAAAPIEDLGKVKLAANWMAAAGHAGEDAALYDTVRAVAIELCPALGISIPVGKDSLSMKSAWTDPDSGMQKEVVAPLSLIVSAFAPCVDVRRTLTPQLRTDAGETELLLVDLGSGKSRLGASALAQVHAQVGDECPDIEHPEKLKAFFNTLQQLNRAGSLLAYHDRSDGGLFAAVVEMMFAGHTGVTLRLDRLVRGVGPAGELLYLEDVTAARLLQILFCEELGAVLQVRTQRTPAVVNAFAAAGLQHQVHVIGALNADDVLSVCATGVEWLREPRISLKSAWSQTSYHMQRLRDNPDCAEQEHARILDAGDPGLCAELCFDLNDDISAPYIASGARPAVAILREQGVNGQVEMAAAFDRAGFTALDVHMSDLDSGRVSLRNFKGFAACGGFSYGDVLGAGEGWAKSILFNARMREEFAAFFQRPDAFALGICNGCQMLSNLRALIPGAAHWPHFMRNPSEQFEARLVMVEVGNTPSLFFADMAGSRIPIVASHGEGYAAFASRGELSAAHKLVALRFIDNRGAPTETYPYNPNGSPHGICGLTNTDGRFTILMPHPERVFRTLQNSWHPPEWGEDGAWLRIFRNARRWVG